MRIKLGPRVLIHIGIDVWPIHKTCRITRKKYSRFKVSFGKDLCRCQKTADDGKGRNDSFHSFSRLI